MTAKPTNHVSAGLKPTVKLAGVAQHAVSQQIKALERTLGVTLLRRTSRRVELTTEGSAYLADARRVLGAADSASRHI